MGVQDEYKKYCQRFNIAYKYMTQNSKPSKRVINEICELRGYNTKSMRNTLRSAGFIYIENSSCLDRLKGKAYSDLALFNDEGVFRLESRYIFPVRDMLGNVIALIGWRLGNEKTKYVTTPSKFFSKRDLFYGLEQLGKTGIGKSYFLCEGIFDCLVLRSLGFNALAMMGISTSREKVALYSLFKRLIGIPDKDSQGSFVVRTDAWNLPINGSYLTWSGLSVKDIDSLSLLIEEESLREVLRDTWKDRSRIINLEVA